MMDGSERVEFADVRVIGDTGLLLICRIGGQNVALPPQCMLPGSEIARTGDRGRLVLTRTEAVNLGLV